MAHHYTIETDDSNGWDDVDYALSKTTIPDLDVVKNPRHAGQLIDTVRLSSCKVSDDKPLKDTTICLSFKKYPQELTSQKFDTLLRTICDAFDHPQNGVSLIIGTIKKKKERQTIKAKFTLNFMSSRLDLTIGESNGAFALVIHRYIRNNYMHQLTQKLLCYLEEYLQIDQSEQICGLFIPRTPMIKKDISFKEAIQMAKEQLYKGYKVPDHKQV